MQAYNTTFVVIVPLCVLYSFYLCSIIFSERITTKRIYLVPAYYYIAHILVLASTVYMFALSLEIETLRMEQVLVNGLAMVIINGTIVFFHATVYQSIYWKNKNTILIQENQVYNKQIEMMNQSMSNIKGLEHDMKNHVLMLQAMHNDQNAEEFHAYVNKLLDEMNGVHYFIDSGNFLVDSIVNLKLQALESEDVEIRLNVDIPMNLEIIPFNLTTIMGNLLDNAVNAVKQTIGEKRLVLNIDYSKGSFILLLDNSYSRNLMIEKGRFKSNKKNNVSHGIGLARVEKIVNQYDGTLQINYTQDVFSVAVIIPLSKCDTYIDCRN